MKFNFRKIVSVLASTVMLGSTIALAAAANYPAPFVQGGNANVAIVYGSAAASSDLVAAASINSQLTSVLASETATSGTGSGVSATGGDSVNLATNAQSLYYGSSINTARINLDNTELPNVLASGTLTDSTGTTYPYTQTIALGNSTIAYGTANGDLQNPALYLNAGTNTGSPLYTYKISFNKNVNVSNSNVIGNDINILGTPYTIGANSIANGSSSDVLYLYGAGTQVTLNEGASTNITIGGQTHTITATSITQTGNTNQVYISVDGSSSQLINQGAANSINGVEIYAKTVAYNGKAGTTSSASLDLGSNVLELQQGGSVLTGTQGNVVEDTLVGIQSVAGSGGMISGFNVSVAMPNSNTDYILPGSSFTDDVFGGLSVNFADTNPSLNDTSDSLITVDTDNNMNAMVTYQSKLATSPYTFSFLHDGNNSNSQSAVQLLGNLTLADQSGHVFHDVEGQAINQNDYFILNQGDEGAVYQASNIPNGVLSSTSQVILTDVATGTQNTYTVGTNGTVQPNINGETYNLMVNNGTTSNMTITWGTGSSYGALGTAPVVAYPRVLLQNGDWFSILSPLTVKNATTYSLPGFDAIATYTSGQQFVVPSGWFNTTNTTYWSFGNANYSVNALNATYGQINGIVANGTTINFNSSNGGAAVLVQEQKKVNAIGNANNGDVIVIPFTTIGTSTYTVGVGQPTASNVWSGLQSWISNSDEETAITQYGSYINYNTANNHEVTVDYPPYQMTADVLFTEQGATVTPGVSGSGSVKQLGDIIVSDSEVSTVANDNLIVVGGSCVNSVAAQLLGVTYPTCGSDWQAATGVGSGSFLIQTFNQSNGNIATLVAGYNAGDTTAAAQALTTQSVDTSAGNKYTGNVATSISLTTNSSM